MGSGLHTSWRHHSLTSKRWKDCRRIEEENKGVLVSRAKVRGYCLYMEDVKDNSNL